MDGWMDRWMDGWMDGWIDEWMDGWIDEWMDEMDRQISENLFSCILNVLTPVQLYSHCTGAYSAVFTLY